MVTVHPLTAHLGRRSTKCIGFLIATLLRYLVAGHLLATFPAAPLAALPAGHLSTTLMATPLILLSL